MAHSPGPDLGTVRPILGEAQALGFLGPADLDGQLDHSLAFAAVLARALKAVAGSGAGGPEPPDAPMVADLGSGGGIPALVVATCLGDVRMTLVESQERRASFLAEAAARVAPDGRVRVVRDRAERVGRSPEHRRVYAAVTARAFARPAITAECAAPLLAVGGLLIVSDPPDDAGSLARQGSTGRSPGTPPEGTRWPADGLAQLGLRPFDRPTGPYRFQVLQQVEACPDRFPRRVGVPGKRPLF